MRITPEIFKAYDIRGKVPKEIDADVARSIGNAAAAFLSKKYRKKALTLLVGMDIRVSSPILQRALIEGITLSGSSVIDAGECTTPLFYFLLGRRAVDGGVMVTASHNPPEYNGFKIRGKRGEAIAAHSGLQEVRKRAMASSRLFRGASLGMIRKDTGGIDEYIAYLLKLAAPGRARIVVDASGGAAALVLPKLLSAFPGVLYKPLFFQPDGSFRVHGPNPLLPEAQEFIREELRSGSFDFGVIFDGDGDRIVFFDEFGNEIRGDLIAALLAEKLLQKHPRQWIVLECAASKAAEERIRALGGKVVRANVGYANIVAAMKKAHALLGGEASGHFYFREFGCNESGMYALLKMIEIVSETPRKLSHLVRPLMTHPYISGQHLVFTVRDRARVIRAIEKQYRKGGKVSRQDGVTVEFSDWWFNARPSNTEPLIRLTLEADTQALFDEKKEELSRFINERHSQ